LSIGMRLNQQPASTTALSFGPSASCDAFGVDTEFGVSVELRLRMADASRYVA